ncbi:MAG: lysophospholipid acyltransferase family protein [Salibacteraceae bacterium]
MLYRTLKILFYLTVKAYFRSISLNGLAQLSNKDKPVIYAANHPSSFMDPILLGAYLKRPLFFLARGDIFKSKLVRPLFNMLHMIPVYKADLSPGQVHKNDSTFEKCHHHLGNNKTILIFPEGTSKTERRLRPIKTGAARIALGAEEKNDFKLGLTIVPIGLNYSDPHLFKSDVHVNFGEPILVSDYQEAYKKDPRDAVVQLTERLKLDLEKQIVVIENAQLEKTIEQIETLYRSTLRQNNPVEEKGTHNFKLSQDIVKAVEHFAKKSPNLVKSFDVKINAYIKDLENSELRDTQIRSSSIRLKVIRRIIYFLIGFPFFMYGAIFNFIPFKLSGFIPRQIKIREDFVGAINLSVGLVVFMIFYFLEAYLVSSYSSVFISVLFAISLYPAGLFSLDYIKNYYKFRGKIKYVTLFMHKSDLVAKLKVERQELIDELEKRKDEYLKIQEP